MTILRFIKVDCLVVKCLVLYKHLHYGTYSCRYKRNLTVLYKHAVLYKIS